MNSIFVDTNSNLEVKSVLVISEDLEFSERIKKTSQSKCHMSYFNENKFYLLNSVINSFAVIVFDNKDKNLDKFIETFKLTKSYDLNIPIIVLEDEIEQDSSIYKYSNVYTVLKKPFDEKLFFLTIELCTNFTDLNKKLQFEKGFYFDINRELLFQNKRVIKLTKTERKLIKLLAQKANTLVTYEEISELVWKGKVFSIYSLRNVVKHIREKTDESFIKNSSNRGYVMNTI